MTAVFRYLTLIIIASVTTPTLHAQGSWVQVPTALQSNPTTHIQIGGLWGVAMADSGNGFAAGYASVAGGFSGVLRKTAGNPTWFVLPSSNFPGLPTNHSLWSAVTVVGATAWVCGSNGRLYKTTDNGNSWAPSTNGISGTNTLFDIHFRTPDEGIVVGSNGTIYFTSDGGANWVAQTLPATVAANTDLYGVDDAGSGAGYWYVTGGTHTLIRGVPRTSSTSWIDLSSNLPGNVGVIEGLQFYNDNIGTITGVIASGSPVHRTVTAGASFTSIGGSLPAGVYNAVHFFDQDNGWVGNALPALYYTTDRGAGWTQGTITPLPSQSISNWLTRITFIGTQSGYASGGAPGTSSTGWILKFIPAQAPDISTTPTSLDFGTFSCGTSIDKLFNIYNTGLGPLNISAITFSHPEFTMLGPLPTPVPPAGGATFSVRWTPTQPGPVPAGAKMTIASNDPANPIWEVDLAGLFNSGTVSISSPGVFTHACVGDSVDVELTATVNGNIQPQLIAFEYVSGVTGVRLVSPSIGGTLTNNAMLTFRYAASTVGPWTGTYRILYGDPLCAKIAVVVFNGSANAASMTATPNVVDFGEVCVGKYKDMLISMRNTGTISAVVSSRTFVGGTDAFPNQHFAPFGPIDPNDSLQYTVRFAPTISDLGAVEGTYKLRIDRCGDSVTIVLRGTGVKPGISFIPSNLLALGPTPVGDLSQEQVTITNSGSGIISLDAVFLQPAHPRVTLSGLPALPFPLGPSQSIIVTAHFAPDRIETVISELVVRYSGPCSDSSRLPVIASSASAPTIALPAVLDMGENICPGALIDTLWVRNLGPGILTLKRFTLAGRDPSHFSVLGPAVPAFVAAGDSTGVRIACNAPAPGSSEAELTIEHDDPKTFNSSAVQLRSERIFVEQHVEGDSATAMESCADVGVSRTFILRNTGLRVRFITGLRVVNGVDVFHVASTPLPVEVLPGSSRSFEVNFTPTSKGNFAGAIEITMGPCNETILLSVRGFGSVSELTIAPSPLDFGSVNIGADNTQFVRITNGGNAPAMVEEIFFRPGMSPGSEHFSLAPAPTLPFVLNSGNGADIGVRFSPQAVTSYSGDLCVVVSAPCPDTIYVRLTGRGTSSGLGLNRTRIEFSLDPCSFDEKCDSVDVLNNGFSPVTLTSAAFDDAGWFIAQQAASLPTILQPGTRVTFRICAHSGFTGTRATILRIATSDASTPELRITVSAVRDSSAFSVQETVLDFGAIAPCERGISKTVTVANTGFMLEIIDTTAATGPFSITETLPVVIQPGQRRVLTVRFSPAAWGVFEDTLRLFNARCGRVIGVILRGAMHEHNASIVPDPLTFSNVPIGSSVIQSLTFENLHLANMRITDVRIQPAGSFASWGAYPKTVTLGDTVSLPILYNPQSTGPHVATACIIIDQPCADTICVSLDGRTSDGELLASPAALDFGDVAQCTDLVLRDTIRNLSSAPIRLISSRIDGADASRFTLLDGISTEETLIGGGERIFSVRVLPAGAADGPLTARLILETSIQPPEFAVPISARRVTLLADAGGTIDFGQIFAGSPELRSVTLRNDGSTPLRYDAAVLPAGVVLSPSLPITIAPGVTLDIDITFTASVPGQMTSFVVLQVVAPCVDSTVYRLLAEVRDGTSASLDMGVVPICLPATGVVMLRNSQNESIRITSFSFEGPDASTMRVLSPATLPIDVAAGDSLAVTVEFNAGGGGERAYVADLVAQFRTATLTLTARAAITVSTHSGRLSVLVDGDFGPNEISFPARMRTLKFRNTSPFVVRIGDVAVNGMGFSFFYVNPALPMTLQPGDTAILTVLFEPDSVRSYSGSVSLVYDAPCAFTQDIPLLGEGVDNRLPVTISMPPLTGAPDDIIEIPISIDRDLGGGVTQWSGAVGFNTSMLYPLDVRTSGTLTEGMQVQFVRDQAQDRLRLSATGGTLRTGAGVLAFVRCLVLVGDDVRTPLHFENGFSFGTAARVARSIDGEFTLVDFCDADGLRLVRDRPGLRIVSSAPSPFNAKLTIEYVLDSEGHADLRLYDVTGRELRQVLNEVQETGPHSVQLQLPDLHPGVYFCVLRHNGGVVWSRLVKTR